MVLSGRRSLGGNDSQSFLVATAGDKGICCMCTITCTCVDVTDARITTVWDVHSKNFKDVYGHIDKKCSSVLKFYVHVSILHMQVCTKCITVRHYYKL